MENKRELLALNKRINVSSHRERTTTVTNTHYFFCSTGCSGTEGIRPVTNFVALLAPYRVLFQGNKQDKSYHNNLIVFHNHYRYIVRRCWTLLRKNSGNEKTVVLESTEKLRNYANYRSFLYTPFLYTPLAPYMYLI